MAKQIISESKLTDIINESIYEVLQEAQYDEGLGHWLGQTFQGLRNKWNNFKGDFKAGKQKAMYDNLDYDPFAHYGDEGNNYRNLDGHSYAAERYNRTVRRNANAPRYERERLTNPNSSVTQQTVPQQDLYQTQDVSQIKGHPSLTQQAQTPPPVHPQAQPNGGQENGMPQSMNVQQNPNTTNPKQQTGPNGKNTQYGPALQQMAKDWQTVQDTLVQNNIVLPKPNKYGKYYLNGFRNADGGTLTTQQRDVISKLKGTPGFVQRVISENTLNKIVSEAVDKAIKNVLK